MKIVAVTTEHYVVEVTGREMGLLTGRNCDFMGTPMLGAIGKNYDISGAWDTIYQLQRGKAALDDLSERLTAVAALLKPIILELPVHD